MQSRIDGIEFFEYLVTEIFRLWSQLFLEHKLEDNISTDIKVMDGAGVGWSLFIENWQTFEHMVINFSVPLKWWIYLVTQ